ncbi:hypothetical protein B5S33_g3814 [[Candida] boidinii]|nr:hypothetical protein B5S30_g3920 [[Candida] boidinii]OWB85156.1 hypothetical protein B5S33_g3814 [[Candida] boidinii]
MVEREKKSAGVCLPNPFVNIERDFICETGNPIYPNKSGNISISGLLNANEKDKLLKINNSTLNKNLLHDDVGIVSFLIDSKSKEFSKIGSNFIITLTDNKSLLKSLDNNSIIFGKVQEGFQVLDKINKTILDENKRPLKDIRIFHTHILEDPTEDPPGFNELLITKDPFPTKEQINSIRLLVEDEDQGQNPGKVQDNDESKENPDEILDELKSKSQAITLELLGDIPNADSKTLENVLFVCKLNPITKEEDLIQIFQRFGKVLSCDIVKDKETGNSLQYGFIEFDTKDSCERAYLKMDNVLIDDRRIHVDFSQSLKRHPREYVNANTSKDRNNKRKYHHAIDDNERLKYSRNIEFENRHVNSRVDDKQVNYRGSTNQRSSDSHRSRTSHRSSHNNRSSHNLTSHDNHRSHGGYRSLHHSDSSSHHDRDHRSRDHGHRSEHKHGSGLSEKDN